MRIKAMSVILLTVSFLFSSCATIFSGTKSSITVQDGSPAHAKVYVKGRFIGETPVTFKLPKKSFGTEDQIEVRADGYKPVLITVDKKVQAGFIVLDILTGVVELIVDFADGAIYKPYPKTIKYNLEKL